jgi:hypothetical protein
MTPERLVQLLDRRNSDGTPYYAREDVLHFLPLLLLIAAPKTLGNLPPHLNTIMLEFSGKLGVPAGATAQMFQKAIDAYYEKNPVNPTLLADFRDLVSLDSNQGTDKLETAPAAAALQSFTEARHVPVPQRGSLWDDETKKK